MSPTELRLRDCLANGSRNSREVIAEMVASGYSTKQVRRARESQGVVVRRSGWRAAMRTTWELSIAAAPAGQAQPLIGAQGEEATARTRGEMHAAQIGAGSGGAEGGLERHLDEPEADLSEAELDRMDGRIAAFLRRGLGVDEARHVARALVDRDRGSVHALGSCIECQAFERQDCPVVPQPAIEIHQCWYRRAATP